MNRISLKGVVISGKKRGREIGYPTANIQIPEQQKTDVKEGTYAGSVLTSEKKYKAAIFVPRKSDIIEAHILDFEGDLYGQEICIEIGQKLRNNIKFENLGALKEQIAKDIQEIRRLK